MDYIASGDNLVPRAHVPFGRVFWPNGTCSGNEIVQETRSLHLIQELFFKISFHFYF